MAVLRLTKKEQDQLRAMGVDTPTDGSDPACDGGGFMQTPGGQTIVSTRNDGWRKAFLKALNS